MRCAKFVVQASAAWQWWNFYDSNRPSGKELLRINLDETSICMFQGGVRGTVFASKKRRRVSLRQRASRCQRRTYITHVAVICDRPDVQKFLPQFIIGNAATFRVKDFPSLRCIYPSNVVIIRQKSAWNNEALCAKMIRRIGISIPSLLFQPVLIMDAVKLHLTRGVFRACSAARMWPLIVPPRMTRLLQPLDTHAFRSFKHAVQESYQHASASIACDARCGAEVVVGCACDAIRAVLCGRAWATAFDDDGFGDMQRRLGKTVRAELQLGDAWPHGVAPSSRPSSDVLSLCFPRGMRLQSDAVWMAFDHVTGLSDAPEPQRSRAAPSRAVPDPRASVRGRTRSETFGNSFRQTQLSIVARRRGASVHV